MSSVYQDLVKLDINDLFECLKETTTVNNENSKVAFNKYLKQISTKSKSSVFQMRKFHNWIKQQLITNVVKYTGKKKVNLLDIAVGRGGDILKWDNAGVANVFGFDISDSSINGQSVTNPGAKARLEKFTKRNLKDVTLAVGDASNPSRELIESIQSFVSKYGYFQIVSCQFALHYFFKTEIALYNVMRLVSDSLERGGYFIGTVVNGETIKKLFKNEKSKTVNHKLFSVTRSFNKTLRDVYSNEYTFTINDSFDETNYFNTSGPSVEYLVNFNELKKVALSVGLEPVNLNFFEPYDNKYTKTTSEMSFEEIYKFYNPGGLTPEELEISYLNSVFVFRKV